LGKTHYFDSGLAFSLPVVAPFAGASLAGAELFAGTADSSV